MLIRRNTNLTEGVIWQQILLFAVPLFLTNFLQQLYNAADLVIVGQFAGKHAMAAIGATGSLNNMIIGLFMGLATGCSVVVAQSYGAGDYRALFRAVHTAYMIAIIGGLILLCIGQLVAYPLLVLMGTPDSIIDLSAAYMRITFIGVLPLLLYNMGAGILRAVGNSRSPFFFLVLSITLNVILDLILVAVFKHGVFGAAYATIISQAIAAVCISFHLMSRDTAYRLQIKKIRIYFDSLKKIVAIGLPAGLQSSVISFSNVLIQSEINAFGANAIAGCAAASRLDGFIFTALDSFALASTTFSGQNLGAKLYDRVRKGAKAAVMIVIVVSTVITLGVVLFARPLLSLFNNNPEVIEYGRTFICILAPFYWILGISQVLTGFVRGAGKSILPMISALIGMCILRTVFIYTAIPLWQDIRAICWAYPFSWAITLSINFVYYLRGKWMPNHSKLSVD